MSRGLGLEARCATSRSCCGCEEVAIPDGSWFVGRTPEGVILRGGMARRWVYGRRRGRMLSTMALTAGR
jgi:hypothetical protein